jgi:hypothetical protein
MLNQEIGATAAGGLLLLANDRILYAYSLEDF